MNSKLLLALSCALSLCAVERAVAQDAEPGAATPERPASGERPGRFRVGPFYLTPRFRIGSIGLDTNVLYQGTNRRADITGSGGPGLGIVVPIRRSLRFVVDGDLTYVYFARTVSQRHLLGAARGALEWTRPRTSATVAATYDRTFDRPTTQVDNRVDQTNQGLMAMVRRGLFGRTSLSLSGTASRHEVAPGQEFLGTDLSRTMTYDTQSGVGALEYALGVKSRFVVEGSYEQTRFPADALRDADSPRLAGGLRTDNDALISGHALVGVRWYEPRSDTFLAQRVTYADVDATWNASPQTHIGGAYSTDLAFTPFVTVTGAPVMRQELVAAHFEQEFLHNVDLRLEGRRTEVRTDSTVRLTLSSGETVETTRHDITYEATATLTYRFWQRLWIGGTATWVDRRSTIADFGVDGLLVGATVRFTP